MKKTLISILTILLIGGCVHKPKEILSSDLAQIEYSETFEYQPITFNEFKLKITEKSDFILVYGSSNCSACKDFEPVAKKYMEETNQKLYYFSASDYDYLSQDNKLYFSELIDISSTPSINGFKAGERIYQHSGFMALEKLKSELGRLFVTAPQDISLQTMRDKRDNNDDFIVLIARPDCGTCKRFNQEVFNLALKNNQGKLFEFNTKQYRDDTENQELYSQIREEFQFNWTPTLLRFQDGKILTRFQWLDNNYYNSQLNKIYYDAFDEYPAIPTTNRDLEGKEYSSFEEKQEAMIKNYNQAFNTWLTENGLNKNKKGLYVQTNQRKYQASNF